MDTREKSGLKPRQQKHSGMLNGTTEETVFPSDCRVSNLMKVSSQFHDLPHPLG